MVVVNIAKDFTRYPSGRYSKNGNSSGEELRRRFLEQPLLQGEVVRVEFDGTIGYGSSFLEEAFGGVVRSTGKSAEYILNHLELHSMDDSIIEEVRQYIEDASGRL